MDIPNRSDTAGLLSKILIAGALSLGALSVFAEGWQELVPPPTKISGYKVLYSLNGVDAARHPSDDALLPSLRSGHHGKVPELGFMDNAFQKKPHTGKLGRVIDALGMQSVYNEPLVRDVLGRVRGSRFCLTGGCGVNLKLSMRKPGVRFEHKF